MADQSGGAASAMASGSGAGGGLILREYRKGNWTLQETMILIEAKKMDDERRLKRSAAAAASTSSEMQLTTAGSSSSSQEMSMMLMMRNKPAELRWKWVEDYCWRRGCFRSQNQCNDKWDNLMRDYKKVRDYQKKLLLDQNDAPGGGGGSSSAGNVSYWNMDKSERKERGLPSNMLSTIYEALVDVVERKSAAAASSSSPAPITTVNTDAIITVHNLQPTTAALSLLHQQHLNAAILALPQPPLQQPHHHIAQPPLPPPLTLPPPSSQPIPMYQTTTIPECLDSDTSSDSPAKRRRKDKGPEITTGPSASSSNEAVDVVANAISKAASKISEAIQASEGRSEQRHREMLELNQRRMQLEEVNRQGTSSLVEAINNLANSILSLAAAASNNNNGQTPPPP